LYQTIINHLKGLHKTSLRKEYARTQIEKILLLMNKRLSKTAADMTSAQGRSNKQKSYTQLKSLKNKSSWQI